MSVEVRKTIARLPQVAATDMPLKGEQLQKDGLVQWPRVMGGVVPAVNLEGVKPGELVLDGVTLARIYLGEIKVWDDAAIKKLNADVKLPNQPTTRT